MHNYIAFFIACFMFLLGCQQKTSQVLTKQDKAVDQQLMSKKQLRHVVLFKFKEDADKAAVKKVERAFAGLAETIPEISDFEWGLNNSPEGLNKGFTHCFFVSFNDEAAREKYLPHPDHKAFVDLLGPVLEDVLVLDYWN